jgi:hypothetical protein
MGIVIKLVMERKKQLNVKIFAMLKAYQKHKDMEHNQDNEEIEGDVDLYERFYLKLRFYLRK